MNDKRELNDILLGGEDVKSKESKKLVMLIIAIVVLIIAIAIIAMLMSSGNKNEETIVVDSTEKVDANIPQGTFNPINIDTNNEEEKFEQIVREIKNKQNLSEQTPNIPQMPQVPEAVQQPQKATMPSKPASSTRTTNTPKSIVTTTKRPTMNRANNGDIAENGYYLQVGAFSKTPNREFLNNIDNYSYRIQEVMINSNVITRYLVGPYPSREAAQRDYDNIAREIAKPVHTQVQ
ncbi:MAG: SPOR domain-containing protein [Helicobacteraceae bacterium]|nr:SPOR domain-containing protein [Helicobacteraceae bacterium]